MLTLPLTLNYGSPVNWQHPLNRGLVSWYKVLPLRAGGGRWVDIANVNHLTLTGMGASSATSGWGATARLGGAGEVRFDGTNDYAEQTAGQRLPRGALLPFTLAGWVKPTTLVNGAVMFGFGELEAGTIEEQRYVIRFTSHIYFWGANADVEASATDYTVGVWQMVTVTFDGTTVLLYKNAPPALATVAPTGSLNGTPSRRIVFGKKGAAQAWQAYYTGALDSIHIWNRALSASEVSLLYREEQKAASALLNYLALPFGADPTYRPWAHGGFDQRFAPLLAQ